ncbi:MAG: bifunctional diguanylate cyclase/phosphodiesterase [Aquihabitans sp.]
MYARRRYNEAIGVRKELIWLSLHDALTGLPNRRLLTEWLRTAIQESQTRNSQAAVLFVDLDRFKYVNDTHGHEIGDRLMRAVARRLVEVVGDRGRLVRFGGDEFVIIATGVHASTTMVRLAEEIIRAVQVPFTVGNESLRISASIGIALAEHRGVNPDDVLRDADVAMYQAKLSGPGQVVTFDRSMTTRLTPATAEEVIRAALENREFHLYYQPVVDLHTGHIVGAEALLRWITNGSVAMSPGDFIPILEETGLIVPVGTWVLQEACRQAARLSDLFDGPPLTITVNVSARQIAQVGFVDEVARALETSGAEPSQIHLEITEGALMHDVESAWAALRRVKSLGVKLALDDFGTGYSSLSYVRRFSLDMLKIDKSFIDGIVTSPEDRAIVQHVVGLAHALGMSTVAEGVEQPEQLQVLRMLGCELAQGYAMSRAIPANDLEVLIAGSAPLTGPPLTGPPLPQIREYRAG